MMLRLYFKAVFSFLFIYFYLFSSLNAMCSDSSIWGAFPKANEFAFPKIVREDARIKLSKFKISNKEILEDKNAKHSKLLKSKFWGWAKYDPIAYYSVSIPMSTHSYQLVDTQLFIFNSSKEAEESFLNLIKNYTTGLKCRSLGIGKNSQYCEEYLSNPYLIRSKIYRVQDRCFVIDYRISQNYSYDEPPVKTILDQTDVVRTFYNRVNSLGCLCDNSKVDNSSNINYELKYKISVNKEGFKNYWDEREFNLKGIKNFIIFGRVFDNSDNILPNTKVTLEANERKFETLSNKDGEFKFVIPVDPNGTKDQQFVEDIYLKKILSKVSVQVLSNKLVANGRYCRVKIKIVSQDGIEANKKFIVSSGKFPLTHNGKTVNYAVKYDLFENITTNSDGVATFNLQAPKAKVKMVNGIKDDKKLFPIEQKFLLLSLENKEAQTVAKFNVKFESPKPHITKVLLPGGMFEREWQQVPSKVFIKDLDSNNFTIDIIGYGRFKADGEIVNRHLVKNFSSNVFEFRFASNKIGFDLNKQPEIWEKFYTANKNSLLSAFSVVIQEYKSLSLYKKLENNPAIKEALELKVSNLDFNNWVTRFRIRYGIRDFKIYLDQAKADPNAGTIADVGVGAALVEWDMYSYLAKRSASLAEGLQLELLKAVYANTRALYDVYRSYRKISDAYEDLIYVPIIIKVTDSDGYEDIETQRGIAVKIWHEGDY